MKKVLIYFILLICNIVFILQSRVAISQKEEAGHMLSAPYIVNQNQYLQYYTHQINNANAVITSQVYPNPLYLWLLGYVVEYLDLPFSQKVRAMLGILLTVILSVFSYMTYRNFSIRYPYKKHSPVPFILTFSISLFILSHFSYLYLNQLGSFCLLLLGYLLLLLNYNNSLNTDKKVFFLGVLFGIILLWDIRLLFFSITLPLLFPKAESTKITIKRLINYYNIIFFFLFLLIAWVMALAKNSGISFNLSSLIFSSVWFEDISMGNIFIAFFKNPVFYILMILGYHFIRTKQYYNIKLFANRSYIIACIYFICVTLVNSGSLFAYQLSLSVMTVPLFLTYILFHLKKFSQSYPYYFFLRYVRIILSIFLLSFIFLWGYFFITSNPNQWQTIFNTIKEEPVRIDFPNNFVWASSSYTGTGLLLSANQKLETGYLYSDFSPEFLLKDTDKSRIGAFIYNKQDDISLDWELIFQEGLKNEYIVDKKGYKFYLVNNIDDGALLLFLREELFVNIKG